MLVLSSTVCVLFTEKEARIVLVGDGRVGKTCFCIAYCEDFFPSPYVPVVFDDFVVDVVVAGKPYALRLLDASTVCL